ncbi:MAG TPA: hypothetical protein VHN11_08440 [Xanthobacteraceae bacterium]|nr:hypothetical protein [Xanthobacteraceae bacterium]
MDTQPTAEIGAEAAPSIEDTLSKTFDAIQARDDEGAAEEAEGQDAGEVAAEGAAAEAATDTAAEEAAETTDTDSAESAGAAEQPLSPPERWSAEDKAKFAGLSREAQDIVLKREADVQRYLTQESQKLAEIKRNYEPLERHLGPRREAWALSGFDLDTGLQHLLALSDFAGRDKPGFIRWFAQQHGVDLGELSTGGGEQSQQPDPKLTALEQSVAQLNQREQQRQQQAEQQARQAVQTAVQEFAADTKAHPFYADVENEIAAILPGIRQQNPSASNKELLQMAYDKATWAHEPTRAKILANQERLKNLEAANAAKKAKAASLNVKTSGSSAGGKVARTIDETMEAAYDRAQARA